MNTQTNQINNETISCSFHPALQELFSPSIQPTKQKKRAYNGTVDPIKSKEDIELAKEYFLSQPLRYQSNPTNIRNYALFVLACNCARRIGDILSLKISDVLKEDYSFKDHFIIKEQKTGKGAKVFINDSSRDALAKYFDSLPSYSLDDTIFKSREKRDLATAQYKYNLAVLSGDRKQIKYRKERVEIILRFGDAIEPRSAHKIMKDMSKSIGLDKKGINVGTHSCRKTWGYNALKSDPTNPYLIATVSKSLRHSNQGVTLDYVGIGQEQVDDLHRVVQI